MAVHSDGSRNTSEDMESGRESERFGWKDGNIRKVYSQSSQFGVGLEEKLWEDLELVSVQATAEKKHREKRSFQGFTHKHSYVGQIRAFVRTQRSTNRPRCHLKGQQVQGSEVRLVRKPTWFLAIM